MGAEADQVEDSEPCCSTGRQQGREGQEQQGSESGLALPGQGEPHPSQGEAASDPTAAATSMPALCEAVSADSNQTDQVGRPSGGSRQSASSDPAGGALLHDVVQGDNMLLRADREAAAGDHDSVQGDNTLIRADGKAAAGDQPHDLPSHTPSRPHTAEEQATGSVLQTAAWAESPAIHAASPAIRTESPATRIESPAIVSHQPSAASSGSPAIRTASADSPQPTPSAAQERVDSVVGERNKEEAVAHREQAEGEVTPEAAPQAQGGHAPLEVTPETAGQSEEAEAAAREAGQRAEYEEEQAASGEVKLYGADAEPLLPAAALEMSVAAFEAKVAEYAQYVGIDLVSERHLLWIAEEGLKAPLPEGWSEAIDQDGNPYFFHCETNETSWEHPLDAYYKEQVEKHRKGGDESKDRRESLGEAAGEPTLASPQPVPPQVPRQRSARPGSAGSRSAAVVTDQVVE